MLDEAQRIDIAVSNLALQKLLYFAHALYLVDTKDPLVSGYFEAWQHGPVHPTAYQAFKASGDRPISFRANRQDPLSGRRERLPSLEEPTTARLLDQVMASYGKLTPGRLVEISHAVKSPWHFVVHEARSRMAFGLRISDKVIIERFKFHKVSVRGEPAAGEPREDTPFAGFGFGADCAHAP